MGFCPHRSQRHFGNSIQMETAARLFFLLILEAESDFLGKILCLFPLLSQFIFFSCISKARNKQTTTTTTKKKKKKKKIKKKKKNSPTPEDQMVDP